MQDAAKAERFAYNANANLVLTLENRSRESGPSSEVKSLSSQGVRSLREQMGSAISRSRPQELKERIAKARRRKAAAGDEKKRRKKFTAGAGVLDASVDMSYKPKTRETRVAYELLLSFVQTEMGDKPHDVLRSAADEVLAIMKDDNMQAHNKKSSIESLFRRPNPMTEDEYAKLFNIGNNITDYQGETEEADAMNIDENENLVPVMFDSEDEEESDLDEVQSDSDSDAEGEETERKFTVRANQEADPMVDVDEDRENELDPHSIDAFWIQRQIAKFTADAHKARNLAEDVFKLLCEEDVEQTENKLVMLLDYRLMDSFGFIKLLLRNRLKVIYCTKLARSKDDTERAAIEAEMQSDARLLPILQALKKTSTAADRNLELEKHLLKEARNLRGGQDGGDGGVTTADAFWSRRPKSMLDLDSLKFTDGGHYMSNTDCELPKGAQIVNQKGYQEVHIPPLKATPFAQDEALVEIKSLPEWAQDGFKGMTTLNRVQSQVYKCAFKSPENMLLCAPTGAGKTNVAVLTMMREIGLHRLPNGEFDLDAFKIVYVAPMKSLVQEMVLNFGKRLEPYGITVKELSGDQQLTQQQINSTQVIVTTPEKWDIITRKSGDRTYTQLVRLVIIDEIHLLHDSRGPVLESIVARTIRQVEQTQELTRLVGLSATLPNYEDVSMFLRVNPDKGLFFFDNSFRPCPLQQQYIGITQKKAFKRHEIMNQITYDKVLAEAGKNQVLVFVHSRKETAATARFLRDMAVDKDDFHKFLSEDGEGAATRLLLSEEAEDVKSEQLKDLLPYGFACHHAGMTRADRTLVEELFADNHIKVLVSTATLAWGVNLPAHTVIIKGTQVYDPEKGRWTELSMMDIMQMLGRAGRPQYDTHGEGIIITTHKELHYYLSLMNEQLPVESQYLRKLADNLNAEIVMGSVRNVKDAVEWLGYTYLYIRMLRKPTIYGIGADYEQDDPYLEQRRIDLIHSAATILDKNNLIKYDRKSGNFQVTDLGRVASSYYITYESMAVFNEYLKPTMSDIELFRVFSMSSEFQHMNVREEEKLELAQLLDKVPIPVKENLDECSAKCNVLLQAYISRLRLDGFALVSDMVYITQSAGRIMRALFEIVLKRGWAAAAVKCLKMCQMIDHRMWGAQSPLRQFNGIPPDIIKRIEGKDFPWESFYDLEPHAIGELIRFPKMGKRIHKAVHQLPRLELEGQVQPITRATLRVELVLTPDFSFEEKVHGFAEPFWILVEDVDGETILHHEFFILQRRFAEESHSLSFTVPIFDPLPPQYYIRVISDRWLGSEVVLPMPFHNLILPERFPPVTELLDLRPIKVTELASERWMSMYDKQFEYFNAIQTQVFGSVYKRDENVMVAAPTSSGKTVVAELAIMRMLAKFKGEHGDQDYARCIYIAPLESLAQERYQDWKTKFGSRGVSVTMLTGETSADLQLVNDGQIVISTPKQWDVMSRRWKTRKNVQNIKLMIVDEMHLIGGEAGPELEVVVSRMRYIVTQTERPIRIVGLSTSIANAQDLAEWIGASPHSTFNFDPAVRPVPLKTRIQGFDHHNFQARQLAMVKPAFQHILEHSPNKPVIVFASSRKQSRAIAIDLMTFATASGDPARFLHVDRKDIEPHLQHVRNPTLKEALLCGVAFYHDGLTQKEKLVVQRLFDAEAIQVVVSDFSQCWGMTMSAHMVILMGTQVYEGREHRYVDCPITDVIQMMGRAARPTQDTVSKCSIFCQSSKKEFYKKFLFETFPVESHLDHYIHDHLNAEIVTKRVENVQDAVDYLTWSFLYRRLTQNPNYYNLQGVSHRHLSDHLSELTENTLDDLQQSKCISIDDDTDLSPLNLGMIAAYYYIKYTTVEIFSSSLKKKSDLPSLLEILCASTEFESVSVRHREEKALMKLSRHLLLKVPNAGEYTEPRVKTHILLQSHFSRIPLSSAVKGDLDGILPTATRLLLALVDVISSSGWLKPALVCMEMSQMIIQGVWNTQSRLLQVPHFDDNMITKCEAAGVKHVSDILELEDDERDQLLSGFTPPQMMDVANFCNSFPDIEMDFKVEDADEIEAGEPITIRVQLTRDPDDDSDDEEDEVVGVPLVSAKRYPQVKSEGWWVVVGNPKKNELISLKRVAMKKKVTSVKLQFLAPAMGKYEYVIYLMSDSYLGCDQEYPVTLDVAEGNDDDTDDDSSDSDSDA